MADWHSVGLLSKAHLVVLEVLLPLSPPLPLLKPLSLVTRLRLSGFPVRITLPSKKSNFIQRRHFIGTITGNEAVPVGSNKSILGLAGASTSIIHILEVDNA